MDVPAIAKIAFTSETGCGKSSTTSTGTASTHWPPSTREADRRSSRSPSTRRSERSPSVVRPTTANRLPPSRSPSWPTTWCERGWSRTSATRDSGRSSTRRVSLSSAEEWKESNDPDFVAKKNRILELYDLADGKAQPAPGDPDLVVCYDEFGPLNLQPHPGHHWAERDEQGARRSGPRCRRRATYKRPHGVRHLLAAYDLSANRLYGHIKVKKGRTEFLAFLHYVRSLHPPGVRIAVVLDNFSPICRRRPTPGLASGREPTTSSSPTPRTTPAGSTAYRLTQVQ